MHGIALPLDWLSGCGGLAFIAASCLRQGAKAHSLFPESIVLLVLRVVLPSCFPQALKQEEKVGELLLEYGIMLEKYFREKGMRPLCWKKIFNRSMKS